MTTICCQIPWDILETKKEYYNILRFQFETSSNYGGRRYISYVFTEDVVAMLATILKSIVATQVSIIIIGKIVEIEGYIFK